jgi:hypothetical protein
VFARCSRDSARRHRSRSVQRASIHSEISGLSKIARGKRKRRKKSVVGKRLCAFSGCGTFSLLELRVSRSVPYTDGPRPAPPDRIRQTSSRNNCRSWQRCRPSRNSASGSSRSGRPRGQPAWRTSQKYQLCQKYLLDLWSRVLYNPISLSEEGVIPTLFSPSAVAVDTLRTKSIPFIHPSIHHPFLALLSSRYSGSLIHYNRSPFSLSHDLTVSHISFILFVLFCLF